ncbi:hypothetical protein Slin14017_G091020 [Septoria linicola]|nr:hypothetical protein Slin14017_G091020 [Septoria linicola]
MSKTENGSSSRPSPSHKETPDVPKKPPRKKPQHRKPREIGGQAGHGPGNRGCRSHGPRAKKAAKDRIPGPADQSTVVEQDASNKEDVSLPQPSSPHEESTGVRSKPPLKESRAKKPRAQKGAKKSLSTPGPGARSKVVKFKTVDHQLFLMAPLEEDEYEQTKTIPERLDMPVSPLQRRTKRKRVIDELVQFMTGKRLPKGIYPYPTVSACCGDAAALSAQIDVAAAQRHAKHE